VISIRADAGLHESKVFLPIHSFIFLLCAHQAPETLVPLLRLPTSKMTILPAKKAACDLCGLHGNTMRRLLLENWSAIVLKDLEVRGECSRADIYIYLCLFVFTLILLL